MKLEPDARARHPTRSAFILALCIAALSIAGCARAPVMDGGIVGTGNRIDCAAVAKKERTDAPVPEECKP
jgi:hypothetical protein